ncbi:hypothetical protein VKT23_011160 [Stygiomarasmius scandens]|uniref:Uncharacterized protein n=1 Tax=Marasmiellus scandens TaxID=2682957 RepID=A0ABR1JCJ6_9AGAR
MSWAAWRETKRPEDQAYCLMGLFDVNLSPIYGEGGPKAFMRLQQEIIKNSNDRSIFAWVPHEENIEERGLLAITPYEFRASGDIQSSESLGYYSSFSFKFNNNGLHIFVSLTPTNSDLFLASLQCQSQLDGRHLYVYLKKTNLDAYKRCQPSQLLLASSSPQESLPSSTKEVSSSLSQGAIQEIVVWENLFLKRDKLDHKITLPPHKAQHCKLIRSWSGQISEPALQRTQISLSQTPVFVPVQHFTQNYKYATESGEHFWVVVQGIQRNVVVISELQEAYGRVEVLKFQVLTDATSPTVSEASDNPEILFKNSTQWSNASWIDRISAPLKSGKIATLSLHITGNAYNLEVSCFDKKLDSGLIEYPKLGFLVPTEIDSTNISSPFILRDVFPADYFQKKDGKKSYISMPDTGTHHNGQTEPGTFRVLFYESSLSYGHGSHKAFVAVGFHDGNLWTDTVTFQPYAEHPEAREIWNSYLDGGSRTQAQLDCQLSTSHNIMQSSTLLVSVGKRENLQLGTHFLHIEIKERQISTDVN